MVFLISDMILTIFHNIFHKISPFWAEIKHYGTLINDYKRKRTQKNENCLVLRVTASSISIAPANCASTVPFTACSTADYQLIDEFSNPFDDKLELSASCEEGWLEDGKNNCLKVLPYEDGISQECE